MKRWHFFEFEDQSWFPSHLRDLVTELLQYDLTTGEVYKQVVPELKKVMQTINCNHIIDLCSGGGGALLQIQEALAQQGYPVSITLTDKYPNLDAFQRIRQLSNNKIDFRAEPVDATDIPFYLKGIRTLFTAFNNFKPEGAKKILQDAVAKNAGIGIFEFTEKKLTNVITQLFVPIMVLFQTPFVRPFKWSRLFWTYVIPILPFIYFWDGLVSNLRTYSPEQLHQLISEINSENYHWEIKQLPSTFGSSITVLIGYPTENPSS